MIARSPEFGSPRNKNIKVWRYMDFTKFVSLLSTQALYFPRADRLGDPFEGSWPKLNVQNRQRLIEILGASDPVLASKGLSSVTRKHTTWTYINCWHCSDYESAAMWKVYVNAEQGIAIQTTYTQLRDCLGAVPNEQIYYGRVRYLDYSTQYTPHQAQLAPFACKRKSFEHEKEVRAVILRLPNQVVSSQEHADEIDTAEGLPIRVDLTNLIQGVFVAPNAPTWLLSLVEDVSQKYNLSAPVRRSQLDEDPLF